MKSNSSLLPVAAAFFAGLVAISGANRANAQSLDPQTGMPVFEKRGNTHFDPASGLPRSDSTNEAQADQSGLVEAVAIESEAAAIRACLHNVVFQMSAGDYEKALQRCLTAQSLPKTESEAQLLFSQWAKLGQLYPPAEQALRKIRDEDTRQFSEAGGGSLILFSQVAYLNRLLQDEAATCALFKQIASQNPPLAYHFYPVAEDALFSQGEHLPQYAGGHSRAEGELALACGMPEKFIHLTSPFMQVTVRIARGEYDQALRLIQSFCQQTNNFPAVAVVLPDWMELARIYPPAMQTMIKVRDRDTREFEQAKDGFNGAIVNQFLEASLLNNALGETNATYAMCQRLEQHNPAQFQACFYLMEPLLMQHGDYQLCLKSIGDPQANLEMMRTNLEFMRKVLPRMREGKIRLQRQTEKLLAKSQQAEEERDARIQQFDRESLAKRQQSRQELWAQLRTNTPDADEMPLSPPPNFMPIQTNLPTRSVRTWQLPPDIDLGSHVTNIFVNRVCLMVDVLVAADHKAEAENIRDQAVVILNDPRLKSAVTDAEQKLAR